MADGPMPKVELLCRCIGDGIPLAEALRQAGDGLGGAVALLYTPRRCRLARFDGGVLLDEDGRPVGGDVFEARVFNESRELRWLQNSMDGATRLGRAVLIEEAAGDRAQPVEALDRSYILWGEGDGVTKSGWSRVSEARIGPLWLPVDGIGQKEMVELTAREYIARDCDIGNAYIADERLTGLRPYTPQRERTDG